MIIRTRKNSPSSLPTGRRFRSALRIEELESRHLMSATTSLDNLRLDTTTYSSENILVRWEANAQIGTGNRKFLDLQSGLYRVGIHPGETVDQALKYFQGLPGVDYATPDYEVRVERTPNDPSFTNGSLYGMTKIGAPTAWDNSTGSESMIVAVIDSGVDYNHPDLAQNIWTNSGEIPGDNLDNDQNGFIDDVHGYDFANNDGNPMDDNEHGTHVAGTIGAVGNNSVGVVGVNWNVKIMAIKFLQSSGSGSLSNAVQALNYAVQMGAKVSNNSWGGGGTFAAMDTAVANARAAGHIFVVAAGNEANDNDRNPSFPAAYNYDNIMSVAASDSNDALARFSNYGATSVDLAAPGVNIYSTTPANSYKRMNGTSMASPHVAGAVALVWSAYPTLSYSQVIDRIYRTVDPIPGLAGKVATGGRLNVGRALGPLDVTGARITGLTLPFTKTVTGMNSINRALVTFNEAINPSSFTAADVVITAPNGSLIPITSIAGDGTSYAVNFATQTAVGTYKIVIGSNISDRAGNLLDQNRNGINGEISDSYAATRTITTLSKFTNSTALPIRDFATVTSTLNVTSALVIRDLDVKLNLTHTNNRDLVITLIAPDGTRILLSNRRGGSGDNYTNTKFDDEATTLIANGAAPFSGTFRPDASLSGLDGKSTLGAWKLEIRDAAFFNVGTLLNWSLIVTPSGTPPFSTSSVG